MRKEPIVIGLGVSEGIGEGIVKLVMNDEDVAAFEEGSILVTEITDPTMTAIMAKSAAIVCDIGGLMSHPSIVSREMGIPCIVNTKEATIKLKDNMKVQVDGKKGKVYLL